MQDAAPNGGVHASAKPDPANPFFQAYEDGMIAVHNVCGTVCAYEQAPTATSYVYFGAFCPRCMRSMMLGEVMFGKKID